MPTLKARIAAGLCKTRRNAVPKVTQTPTLGRLTSPQTTVAMTRLAKKLACGV